MNSRKLTAVAPTIFASSAGIGRTLETDRLPVVGAGRKSVTGQLIFWRRYALVLTGYFVVRIVLDLVGFGG